MKKIEQIDFTCGNITRNILLMVMPLIAALIAANIYLYHKFKKVGTNIILED